MTTATTTTVIDHTSDAAFRAWVAEMITQLLAVGLTQTADTGQINTSTVVRTGTNTIAGYTIWRFNDTAQSTSPIFIKLEFGTGSTTTQPTMMITVGTGSNGSGTLTGTTSTRRGICGGVITSSSTTFISRWCYNATDGVLAMAWKIGSVSPGGAANGGAIFVARTTDTSGASTTTGYICITNGSTSVIPTASTGAVEIYNFGSASLVTLTTNLPSLTGIAYGNSTLVTGGNTYLIPFFFLAPVPGVHSMIAFGLIGDFALGATVTVALVGSTTHMFVSVGDFFGNVNNLSIVGATWMMIWE